MKKFLIVSIAIACLAAAATLPTGCGGTGTASSAPESQAVTGSDGKSDSPSSAPGSRDFSEYIENSSDLSDEELAAAEEAIRCAEDCNTGSRFKACRVRCHDGWAMVDVEETKVPLDEAVGFSVVLEKRSDTRWEVVETGTGFEEDDIPGAPAELFSR